jgi:ribosomal silencing factor RsfS
LTEKTNLILKTLHDKLGVDITTIEFTDSTVADTFIIATGNVPSHTHGIPSFLQPF